MSASTQLHYRLTTEEWITVVHELKSSERDVLYYLRTLDPFGDRQLNIGVREIAEVLGLNPGTVSRALKKLDRLNYIDMEPIRARVRLLSKGSVEPSIITTLEGSVEPSNSTDTKCCPEATKLIVTQQTEPPDNTTIYIDLQTLTQCESEKEQEGSGGQPKSRATLTDKPKPRKKSENSQKDQSFAAASSVENAPPEVGELLSNQVYVRWLASRSDKTQWGSQERFLTGTAFARAWIRKHPEAAHDMFLDFEDEMTHRVTVINQRLAGGVTVTDQELEETEAIALYSAVELIPVSRQLPAASPPPPAPPAPPHQEPIASPALTTASAPSDQPEIDPDLWKKIAEKLSLKRNEKSPSEPTQPTDQFEKHRSWLRGENSVLRGEAIKWVNQRELKSRDVEVFRDELGNPYDFQKCQT